MARHWRGTCAYLHLRVGVATFSYPISIYAVLNVPNDLEELSFTGESGARVRFPETCGDMLLSVENPKASPVRLALKSEVVATDFVYKKVGESLGVQLSRDTTHFVCGTMLVVYTVINTDSLTLCKWCKSFR